MANNETLQGLASIGIKVTVGSDELNYVKGLGDIGGEPNSLDATCFKDKVAVSVPGVKKNDNFNIDFLFDNTSEASDYRKLSSIEKAGAIVPVVVEFPDKTKFSNTGYISVKITGPKVDGLIEASASVSLQGEWTVTNPASE